jgi:hypothetical protein
MRIEFLLEEPSMANFLEIILPKILPDEFVLNQNCFLRPHNGKSDLVTSIPRKVRVFSDFHEPVKIVIVHDQDSNDCLTLKSTLVDLCQNNGDCPALIRIACRELESWYLGDMDAIETAYPKFKANNYKTKAKFRNPDKCDPYSELKKIIPDFQKGNASKTIPRYMQINSNRSDSFKQLISGLSRFLVSEQ